MKSTALKEELFFYLFIYLFIFYTYYLECSKSRSRHQDGYHGFGTENLTSWLHWVMGHYFNDISTWSKAYGASALRACPKPLLLV